MIKRTPESEAKRIAAVQRALKGKPATEAQRKARHEGLLRAWRQGRIRPYTVTPEQRRARSKRMSSVPKTEACKEKLRLANIGQKRSADARRAMSLAQKERIKKFGINMELQKGRERWSKSPGFEERLRKLRGRPATRPLVAKGPTHFCAKEGELRSPDNVIYHFKNLCHFVREHKHLFSPEDVIWRTQNLKQPSSVKCRASNGLRGLFSIASPRGSWKGWTRVSHYERIKMDNRDPLDRTVGGFKSR